MKLSERQRELMLSNQIEEWPRLVALGKQGNPFATLCYHCFGRHKPPHTDICPYDPPKPSAAELYGSVSNGHLGGEG